MDAACTSLRTGAKKVTIACLENRGEMPANKHDLKLTLEEGVELITKTGVESLEKLTDGRIAVTLKKCVKVFDAEHRFAPEYGEIREEKFVADTVIAAIGQGPDTDCIGEVSVNGRGLITLKCEACGKTNVEHVYASGDVTYAKETGSLAGAVVMGMRAAKAIAEELGCPTEEVEIHRPKVESIDQTQYNHYIERNAGAEKEASVRVGCMGCEIVSGLTADEAEKEVKRCLVCGTAVAKYVGPQNARLFNTACNNCHNCVDVCKEKAIHFEYTVLRKDSEFEFAEEKSK